MAKLTINTRCYFDGQSYHSNGPYRLLIEDGRILAILQGESAIIPDDFSHSQTLDAEFLMPGMVEAHCHLFLDGGELDFQMRSEYLQAPLDSMLRVARKNVAANLGSGITLIRDAGDRYGVNHAIREEYRSQERAPVIRSPGLALRQIKKYGAFMAREVSNPQEIISAITETANSIDDLKILLTGIINFEAGAVTSPPQFDLECLRLMVKLAAENGLKTFAHCSGLDGLKLAVTAGVDSIEHGFFMDESILDVMAEKQIAWVPTFSPVYFQWAHPELANWSENTIANLRGILDEHLRHVELAYRKGVPLLAGSDAGSYGVCHGAALIDELYFFLEAGLPMQEVLESVTSRSRRLWNSEPTNIRANSRADLVALGASPFEDSAALRDVRMVYCQGSLVSNSLTDEVSA